MALAQIHKSCQYKDLWICLRLINPLHFIIGVHILHSVLLPFHSHKWPGQNFSLQYQNNIKQAGDENREEYQLWDY